MADAAPACRGRDRIPQQHWDHQILHQRHIAFVSDSFAVLPSHAMLRCITTIPSSERLDVVVSPALMRNQQHILTSGMKHRAPTMFAQSPSADGSIAAR